MSSKHHLRLCVLILVPALLGPTAAMQAAANTGYVLGPQDEITVRVLNAEEFTNTPLRLDSDGQISLPLIGRVPAFGRTLGDLESEVATRLRTYIRDPHVSINIALFGSQPVSVLGAVKTPGVYQLAGQKTLAQVISLAQGLTPDAGGLIRIVRSPRRTTQDTQDPVFKMDVIEISVDDLLRGSAEATSVPIVPNDTISVPKASMIYVMGDVHKPGGHMLSQRNTISVLEALAMAEGALTTASKKNAVILRKTANSAERTKMPVNLNDVLAGKAPNELMLPDDILLVPHNVLRAVAIRSAEAAIQLGTGIVIWR